MFSHDLHINGWEHKHDFLKKLLWKHAIMYEHVYGKRACLENRKYSLHIVEEVKRHSTVDNYCCYVFEHSIKLHNADY